MKKILLFIITVVLLISVLPVSVLADTAYKTITTDKNGNYIETQTAYNPVSTIEKIGDELLSSPSDMVIWENKIIISDTGNNRIVISSLSGELISIINNGKFKGPKGLCVSEDGYIYVADPLASAVFCLSFDGVLKRTYNRPTELLFGKDESYVPINVAIDGKDNLYVASKGNSNGIIQLSVSTGEFLGYFGANNVKINLWDKFFDAVFTKEQKQQLKQTTPASISNITVVKKGIVYTLTDIKTEQVIRKLNMSGNDMLKNNIEFDNPSDIIVSDDGNIFAATTNGYILEFNSDGDLLFIFGGFDDGSQRIGLFGTISSIALDNSGLLYALDDTAGQIQTFKTTEFTGCGDTALSLYQEGKYIESKKPLEKVLLMNNLFDYAHKGIAEAHYMEEDYKSAMYDFRLSNDKNGYSKAFSEQRNKIIRQNIFLILAVASMLVAVSYILYSVKKKKKVAAGNTPNPERRLKDEILFIFKMPNNPFDAYYGIKKENKVSILSSTILYIMFICINLADKYLRGYIFSSVIDGQYYVVKDIAVVLGILLLVILCHYLICSITEGEASLKDVYCGLIYALMPYIVLRPLIIILTHILSKDETFIINIINFIIISGCAALIIIMIVSLNNYKLGETVKCIFWTLFSILVAVAVLFVLYIMAKQVISFITEIANEVDYRVKS